MKVLITGANGQLGTDYIFGGEAEPRATPYTEFDTPG